MKRLWGFVLMGTLWIAAGCTVTHKVEPIYVTVDVNIKVQQELESVFDFEAPRGVATELPVPEEIKKGAQQ